MCFSKVSVDSPCFCFYELTAGAEPHSGIMRSLSRIELNAPGRHLNGGDLKGLPTTTNMESITKSIPAIMRSAFETINVFHLRLSTVRSMVYPKIGLRQSAGVWLLPKGCSSTNCQGYVGCALSFRPLHDLVKSAIGIATYSTNTMSIASNS